MVKFPANPFKQAGNTAKCLPLLLALGAYGCSEPESGKTEVITTVAQLGQPLSEIFAPCSSELEIDYLLGEGVDPHLYQLTRSDIEKMHSADMIFYVGYRLEANIERIAERMRSRKPVFSSDFWISDDQLIALNEHEFDPHFWMDAELWGLLINGASREIMNMVSEECRRASRETLARFLEDLKALDEYGTQVLGTVEPEKRYLITSHDAFSYLSRRYNLTTVGIQGVSTQRETGINEIREIVSLVVNQKIPVIFTETSVSDRNVRSVLEGARSEDAQVIVGPPLFSDSMGTRGTFTGTYLGMLDYNLTRIARALGGEAPQRGFFGKL